MSKLILQLFPQSFVICRLGPEDEIPVWVYEGDFYSITRTGEEISVVCSEKQLHLEEGWAEVPAGGPDEDRNHRRRDEAAE